MAQIQHEAFNGIHKFKYNENDIKIRKEEIRVQPDEHSDEWVFNCYNPGKDVAGYNDEYIAIGNIYEKKIYYVKCPICDEKIIIKEKQGKFLGNYTAKDYRISC